MLRLDWNILFNIINLIILYLLMKRFLFKPVNAILEKRQQAADAQFAEADRQKAEAKESQEHYDALVQGAEDEKKRIVADARQEASAEYGRIVSEAKDKADGIVEKAKADAENEKAAAMQQADAAVRDMVVTAAARMVAMKAAKERAERAAGALGLDELIAEQESEGDRSYEEFMEFLAQRGEDEEFAEQEKTEEPLDFISPEEKQAQDHAASEQIADGDTAAMEDSLTASMTEDLERSAGEFDQQDLELMMAFGEDGKLNEEVGQQRAQELREEIARRREDTYDRMVRAKGEKSRLAARTEYVSAAQNKEIFAGYKKRYGKTLMKAVLGVVLLVLLFLYENAFWIGMKLPQALDSTAYPVIHTLINYQLTLLAGAARSISQAARGGYRHGARLDFRNGIQRGDLHFVACCRRSPL